MKIFNALLFAVVVAVSLCVAQKAAADEFVNGSLDSGVYNSDANLITQNTTTVSSGKRVLFVASGDIILNSGFEAQAGSTFRARLGNYPGLDNDTDNDTDGLPDWWKLLYFDDTSPGRNDDTDGDGVPNYIEYKAGLDPSYGSVQGQSNTYEYDAFGRLKKIIRNSSN